MSSPAEQPSAEDFIHRMRHCFFGDRNTHWVRPVAILNLRTACNHWVWPKSSKSLPRSTKVTCQDCVHAVEELTRAAGGAL